LNSSNGDCGGGSVNSKLTATIHLVISATIGGERVAPEVIQAGRRSREPQHLKTVLPDGNSIKNGATSSRCSAARRHGRSRRARINQRCRWSDFSALYRPAASRTA
jgi:hypothetical protein